MRMLVVEDDVMIGRAVIKLDTGLIRNVRGVGYRVAQIE